MAQQRAALVRLYEATNGTAWSDATGWLGPAPPCSPGTLAASAAVWMPCSSKAWHPTTANAKRETTRIRLLDFVFTIVLRWSVA